MTRLEADALLRSRAEDMGDLYVGGNLPTLGRLSISPLHRTPGTRPVVWMTVTCGKPIESLKGTVYPLEYRLHGSDWDGDEDEQQLFETLAKLRVLKGGAGVVCLERTGRRVSDGARGV